MASREAGGFWISPQGEVHQVKNHAPFAYKALSNELIGASETVKPIANEAGELDFKGMGGAEAKGAAVKQLGDDPNNPNHSQSLRDRGWVQVHRDGDSVMAIAGSTDVIKAAWQSLASLLDPFGSVDIVIIGPDGSSQANATSQEALSGGAEVVTKRLEAPRQAMAPLSGLGMWIRKTVVGPKYFVE